LRIKKDIRLLAESIKKDIRLLAERRRAARAGRNTKRSTSSALTSA
jgi:hypothetical protein